MGATAAMRGYTFQAAITVEVALNLLESGHEGLLQIEGDLDAVDYAVEVDGELVRLGQVRSRQQPGLWRPAEVAAIIAGLAEADAAGATLEFVSDTSPSEAAGNLAEAIARAGHSDATSQDRELLRRYELLALGDDVLRRVVLWPRRPATEDLLRLAELRLVKLFRAHGLVLDLDIAHTKVVELLTQIMLRAGGERNCRRLTRNELAGLVDLPGAPIVGARVTVSYEPREPFTFVVNDGSTAWFRLAVTNRSKRAIRESSAAVADWRWDGAAGSERSSVVGERLSWHFIGEVSALKRGRPLLYSRQGRIQLDPHVAEWLRPLYVKDSPSRLGLALPSGRHEFTGAGQLRLTLVLNDAQGQVEEFFVVVDWNGETFRDNPSGLPGIAVG